MYLGLSAFRSVRVNQRTESIKVGLDHLSCHVHILSHHALSGFCVGHSHSMTKFVPQEKHGVRPAIRRFSLTDRKPAHADAAAAKMYDNRIAKLQA
mgnify:CR=1 FL=1